jgi:hypothetical protein
MHNPNIDRLRNPTLIHRKTLTFRISLTFQVPCILPPTTIQLIQRREREVSFMALAFLSLTRDRAPVATRDVVAEREWRLLVRWSAFEAAELERSEKGSHGYETGGCDRYARFDERPDHGRCSTVWGKIS